MWFSSWLGKRRRSTASGRNCAPRQRFSFRPKLEALEDRWLPSQIGLTVTSLADSGAGTLRAAIQTADAGSPSDKFTIDFAVTGTIDLQTPLPDLNNTIAIEGPGATSLTVERATGASFVSAIVTVDSGQTANLSGLTIANGTAGGIFNDFGTLTVSGCAISGNSADFGGGILNEGTLTVSTSTLAGNSAHGASPFVPGVGGGIYNSGAATFRQSILSGNSAAVQGGGIYSVATVTLSGSTISGNSATYGGGVFIENNNLTIASCIISGNSATYGGGIYNETQGPVVAAVTVRDSLLTGNSATQGGAIYNTAFGTLEVQNSTFTGNTASDSGGGIYNLGMATLQECTLSGNTAGAAGGGIFNGASGALTIDDSTVCDNFAALGADLDNLGVATINDSDVCVIGP